VTDIVVSYARPTEAEAQRVEAALRGEGFTVWRDDELPAHRSYAEVIQERLASAKAVVVLWSDSALKSQWVRAEADLARNAGTLVQVSLDGARPPLPFNQIECADFRGWRADAGCPGWQKVLASLSELVGVPGRAPVANRAGPRSKISVCVLPFINIGEESQSYFSDGLCEDIVTDLSKVSALGVISRTTSIALHEAQADLRKIARDLGVSHVLEGSVRRDASRIRITAQLIDGGTDQHLWAERYDRQLDDIFDLQSEVSQAIVSALKVSLLPDELKSFGDRGTTNSLAYDLYLMARRYLIDHTDDVRRPRAMIRLLERAVELDPTFSRGWALLARGQRWLRLGFGVQDYDGLEAAERALALNPNLADPHAIKASWFNERGRTEEADTEIAAALRLEPDSFEVNRSAGEFFADQHRYPEAIACLEKALLAMDGDLGCPIVLASCCRATNDADGARAAAEVARGRAERALANDPSHATAISVLASALAELGAVSEARNWVDRAMLIDPDNPMLRYNLACLVRSDVIGIDRAISLIEPYFAVATLAQLRRTEIDPDLESLRSDPRFVAMMSGAQKRAAKPS